MARDGRDGRDGKDADPAQIRAEVRKQITEELKRLPRPRDGIDGKDGQMIVSKAELRGLRVEIIRQEFHIPGVGTLPLATELVVRPE